MTAFGCQAQPRVLYRLNILIHPEQICRVVLTLKLHQPVPGRTVGEGDAIGLIMGEEVNVCPAAGKGL